MSELTKPSTYLIFATRDAREHRHCSSGAQKMLEYLVLRAGLKEDGTWSCYPSNSLMARDLGERDQDGNLVTEIKNIVRHIQRLCTELEDEGLILIDRQQTPWGADTSNKYTINAPRIFAAAERNRAEEKRLRAEKKAKKEARMQAFFGEVEDAVDDDDDDLEDADLHGHANDDIIPVVVAPAEEPEEEPQDESEVDTVAVWNADEGNLSFIAQIYHLLGRKRARRSVLKAATEAAHEFCHKSQADNDRFLPVLKYAVNSSKWRQAMERSGPEYDYCPIRFLLANIYAIDDDRLRPLILGV